ncbi:MAG: hypothetical protein VR72_05645 [Clostridiaceae bacterium BRH_c20a]|nr:MAG: hypothetical protein VR72_05645 [Clostridiaceae bacterium BRH_c20a]
MEIAIKEQILAVVTEYPEKVQGNFGIFITKNDQETQHLALLLSRILKAMVHDLENGVYIIVKH